MIILSIDIGIKNLAFSICKVNKNINNSIEIEIIDWKIINLINNNICQEIKSCKCNAKFYIIKNNNNHYLCNKHTKKYDPNILNKLKNITSNNISLISISESIISNLNKFFNELKEKKNIEIINIDKIIIENQIGPLANRMKSIQCMVTMYFIFNNNNNIIYINSSNKLKYFCEKKTDYKERKKKSIEITNSLFIDKININKNISINLLDKINSYWNEFFNKNDKKDDLADSLLQLIYYAIQ